MLDIGYKDHFIITYISFCFVLSVLLSLDAQLSRKPTHSNSPSIKMAKAAKKTGTTKKAAKKGASKKTTKAKKAAGKKGGKKAAKKTTAKKAKKTAKK